MANLVGRGLQARRALLATSVITGAVIALANCSSGVSDAPPLGGLGGLDGGTLDATSDATMGDAPSGRDAADDTTSEPPPSGDAASDAPMDATGDASDAS